MSESKFLKSAKSGRVFIATDELSKRADMVLCTHDGQLLTGHIAEAESAANGVRESKYIGLIVDGEPGRLFNYTPQLALKSGAVSIDDPAQWNGDTSNVVVDSSQSGDLGNQSEGDIMKTPALVRTGTSAISNQALIDQLTDIDDASTGDATDLEIPDVSGIEDQKEAKGVLCKWAFDNFNVQLNRKWGVTRMSEECLNLLTSPDIEEG